MGPSKPDWFTNHENDDVERHGILMGEIGQVGISIKAIEKSMNEMKDKLGTVEQRQWEERPSAVMNKPPSSRPSSKSDGLTAAKTVGLVTITMAVITMLGKAFDVILALAQK